MYSVFLRLLNERGIKTSTVAKETGISNMTFSDWKRGKSTPKADKMKKIADFFDVTVDYLMTGEGEPEIKEITLTARDERDIAVDLYRLFEKLTSRAEGTSKFKGNPISAETEELFAHQIDVMLNHLKKNNKE